MIDEQTWEEAGKRQKENPTKTQIDHYYDLLEERKDNPHKMSDAWKKC